MAAIARTVESSFTPRARRAFIDDKLELVAVPCAQLLEAGIEASDVQSFPWGEFVFFADPDGNRWSVQQLPDRG